MTVACTGVILAGGLGSRMQGKNKALLDVGGKTIIDRILSVFSGHFPQILVVTRNPGAFSHLKTRGADGTAVVDVVADILEIRCSLTGIHAGLKHAAADHVFVTACDTPFLTKEIISAVVTAAAPEDDLVIPCLNGLFEPLCALYSKRLIRPIEDQLAKGECKIGNLFSTHNLKKLTRADLEQASMTDLSFFNVNTPRDLNQARSICDRQKKN